MLPSVEKVVYLIAFLSPFRIYLIVTSRSGPFSARPYTISYHMYNRNRRNCDICTPYGTQYPLPFSCQRRAWKIGKRNLKNYNSGLKITVGQRTMTGQNDFLSGQNFGGHFDR